MRRGAAPLLAALMLAACAKPTGEPAAAMNEQQRFVAKMEAEGRARAEADPCTWPETIRGVPTLRTTRPRECLDLLPAEVMRGVWFTGMEESGFIPDVDSVALDREISPRSRNPEFDTFLDVDAEEALRLMGESGCRGTCAYAITFVGRRTRYPGAYYTGEGNHVVVVDAMLTGRLLGEVRTRINFPGHPVEYR